MINVLPVKEDQTCYKHSKNIKSDIKLFVLSTKHLFNKKKLNGRSGHFEVDLCGEVLNNQSLTCCW